MFESHIRDRWPRSLPLNLHGYSGRISSLFYKTEKSDTVGWYVFHERDACVLAHLATTEPLWLDYSSKRIAAICNRTTDYRQNRRWKVVEQITR